ncbi:MAG: hypothetical protein R3A44_12745 [Caldilineaceae bacterium]
MDGDELLVKQHIAAIKADMGDARAGQPEHRRTGRQSSQCRPRFGRTAVQPSATLIWFRLSGHLDDMLRDSGISLRRMAKLHFETWNRFDHLAQ